MNALLGRDVSERFILDHSSFLLWMGCGDRCGNKMPTGSFKCLALARRVSAEKEKSAWKGVESGGIVGAGAGRASADSVGADESEQR